MDAKRLIADFRRRGIRLAPDRDGLIVEPASKLSDIDRAAIRTNKPILLALLTRAEPEATAPATTIRGIDLQIFGELERIWPEAKYLGWHHARIWNSEFWPHALENPRGLASLLDSGDRVVEVRADYLVIEKHGQRLRFWKTDS